MRANLMPSDFKPQPVEACLFTLPNALDAMVAAIVALRAHVKRHNYKKVIHISNMPTCLGFLLQWLEDDNTVVTGEPVCDPDFEFVFDECVAHNFSAKIEQHAVDAFSTLLGSKAMTSHAMDPTFPPKDLIENSFLVRGEFDAVVLSCDLYDAEEVAVMLRENGSMSVVVAVVSDSYLDPIIFSIVVGSKVIIGKRSVYTYLAAALDKRLIELYPSDVHRNWLSKWDSPNYRMIYLDSVPFIAPNVIWRVLEHNKWATMEG